MRIGVDVGGTNTDAVLMDGDQVVASIKSPTTGDVSSGIASAISSVLNRTGVQPDAIGKVMVGTTHLANALVERRGLEPAGVIRLASPSGAALPPMTSWPDALAAEVGREIYQLRGGYEVDGREISPLDEAGVERAGLEMKAKGIAAIAVISAFAPVNNAMEERASEILRRVHPDATLSLSHTIGRIGLIERENATILNAALGRLARMVVASFGQAMADLGIAAPLYISQNDGTLISAQQAARWPVLTIGSGPTNSMRGAAFLSKRSDAVVIDVGGTTSDIGVLASGFPRESTIAVDIGGVRTNFRMPDIYAIGLGGGTRIRGAGDALSIGPDSVGFRIGQEALCFGGTTLTASDVAVAAGIVKFGTVDPAGQIDPTLVSETLAKTGAILADGVDRMKTARGAVPVIAVGGGSFLVPDDLRGASEVIRPDHAEIANAIGAAIAQVGAQVERLVDFDAVPREVALSELSREACEAVVRAGGERSSAAIVDVDEVYLSYVAGRSAQVRVRAVADLAGEDGAPGGQSRERIRYA